MTTAAFGQHTCWCGKPWSPTPDGRWLHRTLFAHTPSDAPAEPPEPAPIAGEVCRSCRSARSNPGSGQHCWGDGGLMVGGEPTPCGCRCGRGPRWRDELEPDEVA